MAAQLDQQSTALTQALGRLELSRARLRNEMIPPPHAPEEGGGRGPFAWPRRARALWRRLRQRTGHWPIASLAVSALGEWWHHHPWRPAGEMLLSELKGTALPAIRRHPVVVVGLAAALGAALVAWRPWRWPGVAKRVRPMPGHLGRWALRQLSSPAVQAALLSLFAVSRTQAPAPPRQPSPTSTPDAG